MKSGVCSGLGSLDPCSNSPIKSKDQDRPGYGTSPRLNISHIVTPNDQTSDSVENDLDFNDS